MNKFYISIIALGVFLSLRLQAQMSDVVSFSGDESYVDLGNEVGSNLRTIEFWFRLNEVITPELSTPKTLIGRDGTLQNYDEFHVIFNPNNWDGQGGRLRFTCTYNLSEHHSVYSDYNSWERDVWYHVACVINPNEGLLLFIDGIRQEDQNPAFTTSTANSPYPTTIASWGSLYSRFFNGAIEELRLSTVDRYYDNFEPPCPDFAPDGATKALYHFDDLVNNSLIDASGNGFNGTLVNCETQETGICKLTVSTSDSAQEISLSVYPNPSSEFINIDVETLEATNEFDIRIIDLLGRSIYAGKINRQHTTINVQQFVRGNYTVLLVDEAGNFGTQRLLVQ